MNDDLQTTEDAFDLIPAEVQQYVYGAEFQQRLAELFTTLALPLDQQQNLRGALFGFIAQISDEEELNDAIISATPNEADRQKIREWINLYVSQKLLALITKAYIENDDDESGEGEMQPVVQVSTAAPTAPSSLSALADSLKGASSSTAVRRDYTEGGTAPANLPVSEAPVAPEVTPRTIDPYHEPIEK
jgi:hypothetical protein